MHVRRHRWLLCCELARSACRWGRVWWRGHIYSHMCWYVLSLGACFLTCVGRKSVGSGVLVCVLRQESRLIESFPSLLEACSGLDDPAARTCIVQTISVMCKKTGYLPNVGNGICNEQNNYPECIYDAGDCCLPILNDYGCYKTGCICHTVGAQMPTYEGECHRFPLH
jgi:hypothetical protein